MRRTTILTKKEAKEYLYNEWLNGNLDSNFTEDHSQYDCALEFTMKYGYYSQGIENTNPMFL